MTSCLLFFVNSPTPTPSPSENGFSPRGNSSVLEQTSIEEGVGRGGANTIVYFSFKSALLLRISKENSYNYDCVRLLWNNNGNKTVQRSCKNRFMLFYFYIFLMCFSFLSIFTFHTFRKWLHFIGSHSYLLFQKEWTPWQMAKSYLWG